MNIKLIKIISLLSIATMSSACAPIVVTNSNTNQNSSVSTISSKVSSVSSTSKENSTVDNTSSVVDSELESKKSKYLSGAVSSLILSYEGVEINVSTDGSEVYSYLYYSIQDDIYQIQSNDSYLTYKDENIYIDNELNHYYYNVGAFDSTYIMALYGIVDYADEFTITRKNKVVTMTYSDDYNKYSFYMGESLRTLGDLTIADLKKIEVVNEELTMTITPSEDVEYYDISENDHSNLEEDLAFLEPYVEYMAKENLDITYSVDYNDIKLEVLLERRLETLNGTVNYDYKDKSLDIEIIENNIYYEEELLTDETFLVLVEEYMDPDLILDLSLYILDIAGSKLTIEDNLITFEGNDFKETITFSLDEYLVIETSYSNVKITAKEVLE